MVLDLKLVFRYRLTSGNLKDDEASRGCALVNGADETALAGFLYTVGQPVGSTIDSFIVNAVREAVGCTINMCAIRHDELLLTGIQLLCAGEKRPARVWLAGI